MIIADDDVTARGELVLLNGQNKMTERTYPEGCDPTSSLNEYTFGNLDSATLDGGL